MNRRRLFKMLVASPLLKLVPATTPPGGTYGNITRSVAGNEFWEGHVRGGHGGPLTEQHIIDFFEMGRRARRQPQLWMFPRDSPLKRAVEEALDPSR